MKVSLFYFSALCSLSFCVMFIMCELMWPTVKRLLKCDILLKKAINGLKCCCSGLFGDCP